MEDWKIKVAALWIVFECGSLGTGMACMHAFSNNAFLIN